MVSLLFYESAQDFPATSFDDLAGALVSQPGVELAGNDTYLSGRWHDTETGATCQIDIGHPPIEQDHMHPPRAYDGWREVGLSVNIPLAGPHWLCVEALQWIENLLRRLPTLRTLDTEDTRQDQRQEIPASKILVVDDEAISRRAIVYALEKAKLKSVNVDDPLQALQLLTENEFDLVFLDVDMPGMTGYELCTKLRALPQHKKTPVVFVTSLNDFDNRTSSTMAGGNDFIGKPFLFIELTVKALIHVLRNKI